MRTLSMSRWFDEGERKPSAVIELQGDVVLSMASIPDPSVYIAGGRYIQRDSHIVLEQPTFFTLLYPHILMSPQHNNRRNGHYLLHSCQGW